MRTGMWICRSITVVCVATCLMGSLSCRSARYATSELRGTARPEGGISEAVPVSKTYNADTNRLWKAACQVLDEQGYIYEGNKSSGMIKTEPKYLNDPSKFRMIGANYSAKLFVTVDGNSVSFKARFNKKSNITLAEENAEYPEKENALRKVFFESLDAKVGTRVSSSNDGSNSTPKRNRSKK